MALPDTGDPRGLIERALSGDAPSVRTLVDRLSPVIMKRVAATLWRRTGRARAGQEAADMAQDVFVTLFQSDGRALRTWDPARGMSFDNFIGLLAEHQVISILRSKRTSPWREEPTEAESLEPLGAAVPDPETITSSREDARLLLDRLRGTFSPRGLELFQRLIVDGERIEELAERTGMTRDALYQWKSRLLRTVRAIGREMAAEKARGKTVGGGGGFASGGLELRSQDPSPGGAALLSETIRYLRMTKRAP